MPSQVNCTHLAPFKRTSPQLTRLKAGLRNAQHLSTSPRMETTSMACTAPHSQLPHCLSHPSLPFLQQAKSLSSTPHQRFTEPAKYVRGIVLSSRDTAGREKRPENARSLERKYWVPRFWGRKRGASGMPTGVGGNTGIQETPGELGPGDEAYFE